MLNAKDVLCANYGIWGKQKLTSGRDFKLSSSILRILKLINVVKFDKLK